MPRKKKVDAYALRVEMTKLGWSSEDRITTFGWGKKGDYEVFGYSIWFERYDWHGNRCDRATFHAHTDDLSRIPEAVLEAAERAKQAWEQFPDGPPRQLADNTLSDAYDKHRRPERKE